MKLSSMRGIMACVFITLLLSAFTLIPGCSQEAEQPEAQGVLYLGFMVHLEGWDDEVTNEEKFKKHADTARELATVFEEYGAKVTFEARPEFVAGCKNWNDNVLKELYNRGHGIGVHADVGGVVKAEKLTQKDFAIRIAKMKKDMEQLTDVKIRHVSGICSELDWVKAAIEARYSFTTGIIGHCAMSLPIEQRPEEYKNCPTPTQCHGLIPVEQIDRMHPWRTSSGANWLEDDPEGKLVILTESGGIVHMAESASEAGSPGGEFTQADIDAFIEALEEAISYSKAGMVNIFYVGLSIGSPVIDKAVYGNWFKAIQPHVDSGQVEWKTLPEMYEAYVE